VGRTDGWIPFLSHAFMKDISFKKELARRRNKIPMKIQVTCDAAP
jgi:hypothetical protein